MEIFLLKWYLEPHKWKVWSFYVKFGGCVWGYNFRHCIVCFKYFANNLFCLNFPFLIFMAKNSCPFLLLAFYRCYHKKLNKWRNKWISKRYLNKNHNWSSWRSSFLQPPSLANRSLLFFNKENSPPTIFPLHIKNFSCSN